MVDINYTPVHQGLLQKIIASGVLTLDRLREEVVNLEELLDTPANEDAKAMILRINEQLRPVKMQVREFRCESVAGVPYVALVNASEDALSELATDYSAPELEYFTKIINYMVHESDTSGTISEVHALNLRLQLKGAPPATQPQQEAGSSQKQATLTDATTGGTVKVARLTMTGAEELLGRFVVDGWFEREANRKYKLSRRTRADLHHYFEKIAEECPDLQCTVCQDIVVCGQGCGTDACGVRMHNACAVEWFRRRQKRECPVCKSPWRHEAAEEDPDLVEEAVARHAAATAGPTKRGRGDDAAGSGAAGSSRAKRRG